MTACARCQIEVTGDSLFCPQCGAKVTIPHSGEALAFDSTIERELDQSIREATAGVYELERLLGRGGMALVYLASEIHLSRKVAIKVLPPDLTFGSGTERFMREAKTAAALDHPNIIPIYRIATEGSLFWYAMKYVDGESLAEMLEREKRLTLGRTVALLEGVADALDYAHREGVIHRDVKPANVMIDDRRRVLMADFGIAKALGDATLTASGSVVGTPYYMSPEQGSGKTVTGKSDQYAVGVMAYQMLSGQVPFDADSAMSILYKHCSEPPPPLRNLVDSLPDHVYDAVDRSLAKNPDKRFPTVFALVSALQSKRQSATLRVSTAELPKGRESDGEKKKRWPRVAAGVGLTLLAAFVATQVMSRPEPPTDPNGQTGNGTVPEASTGELTLTGLPPDATVRIDGTVRQETTMELDAGRREIRVEAPGFGPVTDTVQITAGSSVAYAYSGTQRTAGVTPGVTPPGNPPRNDPADPPPFGILILRTVGGWANITVDGVPRGQETFLVDTLPAGDHRLVLERDGFVTVDTIVTIDRGVTHQLSLPMRRP